jgi:lipoyl-dependent peroxiredoxin
MPDKTKGGTVIYTAETRTTGGRDHGIARSCDGTLDVKLATPGSARIGTNPEQLFAVGWSASFATAVALAGRKSNVTLDGVTIDAKVDLHLADSADYFLSARLTVSIPGVDLTVAQKLIREAELICPYSNATRGNMDVTFEVFTT